MKLVFLTNYFNHHQKPLADEFYRLLGEGNYFFVETTGVPEFRKKFGYKELTAPYVLRYCDETRETVLEIISSFDVVIYSSAPLSLVKSRYMQGKLTFCYSERRYKTISRLLFFPAYTLRSYYINKGFLLCASAYAAKDYHISGMSRRKCFRWGYFTDLKKYDIDELFRAKRIEASEDVSILWAGRLIGLKHPQVAIKMAKKLKSEGLHFTLDIIGAGELENQIKNQIVDNHLSEVVHLRGSMSPDEVRSYMERADIFLFTSDRHEGWGAVLNESMNSACAVVARDVIGSVPFLVQDGVNGMIYHNETEMYNKVKFLITNPNKRKEIQLSAYNSIQQKWNAQCAAHNFLELVNALNSGESTPFSDGPCSQAPLLKLL